VSEFVGLITDISIGLTLMLFLQYYFLKDGPEIVEWFMGVIPLNGDVEDNLVERIRANTSAVIKGHVFVAIAQGLIAGIGLFLTGVPNPGFWTFAMVLLGFIPLIGTIIVWAPASVYLFVIGDTLPSILLAIYGLTIVGLTDNILRPIVVERGGGLHPGAVLIGVIGGVYFFGVAGLLIVPIII
jgi:predicted PurR-regulated permease PerM